MSGPANKYVFGDVLQKSRLSKERQGQQLFERIVGNELVVYSHVPSIASFLDGVKKLRLSG